MHTQLEHIDHRAWTGVADASHRTGVHWTQRLAASHLRLWSGLLAATAALALLLAFQQVVLGGVHQAEFRHQAQAMMADATWRCNALRAADSTRSCLQGLTGSTAETPLAELDRPVAARPDVLPRLTLVSDGVRTR